MGHLERSIAAPTASPDRIIQLVTGLPSVTVMAPRSLSDELRGRLDEIAVHHDGLVPLHGRLFAQWMHHAYPLECPYPHAAGTTQPLTPDEWMDEFGAEAVEAPTAERESHIKPDLPSPGEKSEALPWEAVEELVVRQSTPKAGWGSSVLRKIAAL